MRIHVSKPLFAWDELEDSPTLKTIKQFLETLPDANLLASWKPPAARDATTCRSGSPGGSSF